MRDECLELLLALDCGHVEFEWVARGGNAEADRLSMGER
jgi:hypothetical protein